MHKDTYPHLFNKFPVDNFEVLIHVLQRDYADLYPIEVMEQYYKQGVPEFTAYIRFFEETFTKVAGKYTEKEIQEAVLALLSEPKSTIKESTFMFPKIKNSVPKPLGFVEKLATGHLSAAEPLSYVDMVRSTSWFIKQGETLAKQPYTVIPLANVSKDSVHNNIALINLHPDPKQTPKWIVMDCRDPSLPVVYCEAPILESEKLLLETKAQVKIPLENYQGGKASLSVSSGYTALAWCMKQVESVCALKLDSDFSALVEEFTFIQPGRIFRGDDITYYTSDYRQFAGEDSGWFSRSSIYSFARAAILGKLGNDTYPINDLSAALPIYNSALSSTKDEQTKLNARSYILGFDNALGKPTESADPKAPQAVRYITEDIDRELVKLTVTDSNPVDIIAITNAYADYANKNSVPLSWLSQYVERPYSSDDPQDLHYATAMVLAVFRSCAKLSNLQIDLANKYQLDKIETDFILQFMENNPYVCQLTLGVPNKSLENIQDQLIHIFARNRWLKYNGYKPPMFDDFWKNAAFHWLVHLNQTPDVLLDKRENELFKQCVTEMGLHGLDCVLKYLNNEVDRDRIEKIYGKNRPPFFLNCRPSQMKEYLDRLLKHLEIQGYFPFSELGVTFSEENAIQIARLINSINKLKNFEQITLTDCLKNKPKAAEFLHTIALQAKEQNWTTLVVIPELHDKENVSSDLAEIRSVYAHLNNIILANQRIQKAKSALKQIEETSNFESQSPDSEESGKSSSKTAETAVDFDKIIKTLQSKNLQQWHIQRGGETQLQLQQQQEIQQVRQLQQEHQRMNVHQVEEAFFEGLISYDNIDKRLGTFFSGFQQEHVVNEKYALLKTGKESLLQGFFHTWVNANPSVQAKHVIRYMTKDAVVELLKHQALMVSGLKLDNLPKGFSLQRSKDGDYILSFKADMDYVYPPNAQTLRTNIREPALEYWEGDFRQFDVDTYLVQKNVIEKQDWLYMAAFAKLQPDRDYTNDYNEFIKRNPHLAVKLGAGSSGLLGALLGNQASVGEKEKVIKHWPIVLQAWQYLGDKGVDAFLKQNPADFDLPPEQVQFFLLSSLSKPLQEFAQHHPMNNQTLKALGQVYYRFGNKGMSLLLSKFSQIESQLGKEFYQCFSQEVLSRCHNFNAFMNSEFFLSIDAMMQQLKGKSNEGARLAWQSTLRNHYTTTDWDNITHLWNAFSSFNQEITRMGLHLEGDEFDNIPPNNMIVLMDRVLDCLRHIPNYDNQSTFLRNLTKWDLSHGGLPYAIVQEKFRYFNQSLLLSNFEQGKPTYAPDLSKIYSWSAVEAPLQMQRALASLNQISKDNFDWLKDEIVTPSAENRHILIMLSNTHFKANAVPTLVSDFRKLPLDFGKTIAKAIHQAVYEKGYSPLDIQWETIQAMAKLDYSRLLTNLPKDANLLLLEAASLLHQKNALNQENVDSLTKAFQALTDAHVDLSQYHSLTAFKLGVIFGITQSDQINQLTTMLDDAKPIVQQEARVLFRHLLSVDFEQTESDSLNNPLHWQALIDCIKAMENDPANTGKHRLALIDKLSDEAGIVFKFSKGGNFRALNDKLTDGPDSLHFFVDHEDRVWHFLKDHIAVKVDEDAQEQLVPIMNFLKQLQINVTYLNEIEPLLAILEKTKPGKYWSAPYFTSLLKALTPDDENSAFPINLMKTVIQEAALKARSMNEIMEEFPKKITEIFSLIQKNTVFTRDEQAMLAQIAMREYEWTEGTSLTSQILATVSGEMFANTREPALAILCQCQNKSELENRYQYCKKMVELPTAEFPKMHQVWSKTMSLWLKTMQGNPQVEELFQNVDAAYQANAKRKAQVLHIIAWSSLDAGLQNNLDHQHELRRKAPKLVEKLAGLNDEELSELALCYPRQPAPRATDIVALLKQQLPFKQALSNFLAHPFTEPRIDYHPLALSRQSDLERMLKEVQVSFGDNQKEISVEDCARLSLVFTYLKELESGQYGVKGCDKSIQQMSQEEIAQFFKTLSQELAQTPDNTILQAQVFALMFEAMGRTTRKYPHLAQQFALIANELFVKSDSRVMQLSVGEGKSHYVAMQAARFAAQGKMVDVCTSKRSLAARDLEDYKSFLDYLGLSSTAIEPKTSHSQYMNHQIHYSTLGDLSLFLDEQNYAGTPIEIPKEKRVGLFDEFDFTRFEEGRKTEYNFARPTGYTPKQLTWFYQSINQFYAKNKDWITEEQKGFISQKVLLAFAKALIKDAGTSENRQHYIGRFIEDPLRMVQYLQSAHEAARLERGVNFTVQEAVITVGEEHYPMREIIPLSTDNQRMTGSTFSAGVHQLLAVRLNTEAQTKNEPQNYHVHPESHILSSQVAAYHMQSLWGHREGYSGTISDVQKQRLYNDEKTVVLHAPTNRAVQRTWHQAKFYKTADARAAEIKDSLLECLAEKKSVLVCCKNDKQVDELQKQLSVLLEPEQLKQLIFYTNEDPRMANDVLADKTRQEGWHGDTKEKGIALVASGFGRGDNTGTEAVFILGTRDFSDLTQKGGRTARNGDEGEVYQFYLTDELEFEEDQYIKRLSKGSKEIQDSLDLVQKTFPNKTDADLLHRVLVLREYCFELDNIVNETYHHGLAQYSGWGMRLLAHIDDPILRNELTTTFSQTMRSLEKIWIDIEAQVDATPQEKQESLSKQFTQQATDYLNEYLKKSTLVVAEPFAMKGTPQPLLNLSIPEHRETREYSAELSLVFTSLTTLPSIDWTDKRINELPEKLNKMAKEPHLVRYLSNEMRHAKSAKAYLDWFDRFYDNWQNPSKNWQKQLKQVLTETVDSDVLEQVNDNRDEFIRLVSGLNPSVQDSVANYLKQGHTASINERANRLRPVLRYLNQFSKTELDKWGKPFIHNADVILDNYADIIAEAQSLPTMPFTHLTLFANLLRRYPNPHSLDNKTLFDRLHKLTAKNPVKQIRILNRCESIVSMLPESQRSLVFHDLVEVISQYMANDDWNTANRLLNDTEKWLGKPRHQERIVKYWLTLAQNVGHLQELKPLLSRASAYPSQAWYRIPALCLDSDNASIPQLIAFQTIWLDIWENIDSHPGKSIHKREYFELMAKQLRNLEAKDVSDLTYDKFLIRCYEQLIKRNDTHLNNMTEFNILFSDIERYGYKAVMAFTNSMDAFMKHESGYQFTPIEMVRVYNLCREANIDHAKLCHPDFQHLLRVIYQEMDVDDVMSDEKRDYLDSLIRHLRNYDAKAVSASSYDTFLMRCYKQIIDRKDSHENNLTQLNALISDIEQYGYEDIIEFTQSMETLMQNEKGYQFTPIEMVRIYKLCQEANIDHAKICHPDFQRVLLAVYQEMAVDDVLTDSRDIANLKKWLVALRAINNPSLSKKLLDSLQSASKRAMSTQHALTLMWELTQAGMDEKRFQRYQDTLVTIWERINKSSTKHDEALFSFVQYVYHLVEFDREKLDAFYKNKNGILAKTQAEQANFLLEDVMDFSEDPARQNKRIWRTRFLLDGVLKEVKPESDSVFIWNERKNDKLLISVFAFFADAFKAVFDFISPEKRPTSEERVQAHRQAMDISNEMLLIGNFTPLDYERNRESFNNPNQISNTEYLINSDLNKALSRYRNSWFLAGARKYEAKILEIELSEKYSTSSRDDTTLIGYLNLLKQAKLDAMRNDLQVNQSRWFKLNRSGRSRYYETLNQMQDIVMKHWAMEGINRDEPLNHQQFFLSSPTYQQFVKEDLHEHLEVMVEAIQPFLTKEENTNRYFFKDYHQSKNRDISDLLSSIRTLVEMDPNNISATDLKQLTPKLEKCHEYLPGELRVVINEVLQRAQAVKELPKPDLSVGPKQAK
jgi:hypothetical protein